MMMRSGFAIMLFLISGFFLAGCSEVKGRVTDLETGAPIEDAQLGLILFPAFSLLPTFPEVARTDATGHYQFTHFESGPWLYVTAPGYLTQAEPLPRVASLTRNYRMQSIEGLIGAWEVTINIAVAILGETQFTFTEDGVAWTSAFGFMGEFTFEFDGTRVVIDDVVRKEGGEPAGEMAATLEFDGDGERLTGEIWIRHELSGEAAYAGTITAVRLGMGVE